MQRLKSIVESRPFELAITLVIVANAVTLGVETSRTAMASIGSLLLALDRLFLAIFVLELFAKLVVYRRDFFRDPWRVFDFAIVAVALLPASGGLSVLRALRILRVLRLVSVVPSLKRVVGGLMAALPGMGAVVLLLSLVFYVSSVIATNLFGASFPEWFGSISASAYTLFQIMTLESWSMGIVRPVMAVYPLSWLFFLPFIIATAFAVLNLFIGIIVSAMQEEHDAIASQERSDLRSEQDILLSELRALREEISQMKGRAAR